MPIEVNGNSLETDYENFLVDPRDWNEDVAKEYARLEEIELTETHWKVLNFMRAYYNEHLTPADVRHTTKFLVDELGIAKKDAKKRLFDLFPYGYVKQACKISGMRKPRMWSTG